MSKLYENAVCLAPMVRAVRVTLISVTGNMISMLWRVHFLCVYCHFGTVPIWCIQKKSSIRKSLQPNELKTVYFFFFLQCTIIYQIINYLFVMCLAILNTVDFVSVKDRDSVVFRTSKEEKDRVVFQIGTSDPILALKAAQKVCVWFSYSRIVSYHHVTWSQRKRRSRDRY